MSAAPLWTVEAMAAAMRAERPARCPSASAAFPSTPAPSARASFFAIKGDSRDGHDFVEAALDRRRRALPWSRAASAAHAGRCAAAGRRRTCSKALRALARAARARSKAQVIGVTGSVGKTGTKEALRLALSRRRRDPCLGRLLQQSLGRAAVAGALPGRARATRCSKSA